jgi:two-component system CAI-1 autoinducer sensor kinase/phosphatase CqsS
LSESLLQKIFGRAVGQRAFAGPINRLIDTPALAVLQPSAARLRWMGVFMMVGHPLFAWTWGEWLPQPYEDWRLRAVMAAMGLLFLIPRVSSAPSSKLSATVYLTVLWFQLPVLFSWMYLCNGGNAVWLASLCAMFLIFYQLTDWRVATIGLTTGGLLTWLMFNIAGAARLAMPEEQAQTHAVVIAFSWGSAWWFGMGTSSARRAQWQQTMASMRIMAHELRTPLATITLLTDAARGQGQHHAHSEGIRERLLVRLQRVVNHIHWHLNTQVNNARLMSLDGPLVALSAEQLVRKALAEFPYPTARQRECIQVVIDQDFMFCGTQRPFEQVLGNLVKNALTALADNGRMLSHGDLRIAVGCDPSKGWISVTDQGTGMDEKLRLKIFEPFFSTNTSTGHGLGLPFCKVVVEAARGTIQVKSQKGQGTTVLIELPIA